MAAITRETNERLRYFDAEAELTARLNEDIPRILREVYSTARTTYFPNIAPLVNTIPTEKFGGVGLYFNIDMKPPKMNRSKYLYTVSQT